jgi:hypothetical protein
MPPFQYRWEQLGNPFGPGRWSSSMVLNGNDEPLLASVSGDLLNSNGVVHRWQGNSWSQLGGNVSNHVPNFTHAIAIEAGGKNPSVATSWYTGPSLNMTVSVQDWTGSWKELAGPAGISNPRGDDLLVKGQRRVVAITEAAANLRTSKVQVHLWNGAQWRQLGPALPAGASYSGSSPSLAYDAQGEIVIALERSKGVPDDSQIVAYRWSNNAWRMIGSAFKAPSSYPWLAVGSGGDMAIAFSVHRGFATNSIRCAVWDGAHWKVTPTVSQRSGWRYSLDVEADGSPVLAWENPSSSPQRIEVSWWNGSGWLTFSPAQGTGDSSAPLIKTASTDLPVVAWSEGDLSIFEGPDWSRRLKGARLVPA